MPSHHNSPKDSENPDERALIIGHPKADALPVDDLSAATDNRLEQEALDAGLTHPNRGHDKPSIDKPAYE